MRIASKSFSTDTNGAMLNDTTLGVGGANRGSFQTWVDTSLFDTSLCSLTVGINFTLWFDDWLVDKSRPRLATDEWIALIATRTRADGVVTNNLTTSINAACSRTRITTFLVDASQVIAAIRVSGTLRSASHEGIAT